MVEFLLQRFLPAMRRPGKVEKFCAGQNQNGIYGAFAFSVLSTSLRDPSYAFDFLQTQRFA
jgi:hypothetical protein